MHHRSWDHSSSYAPVFLRREKMGECTIESIKNMDLSPIENYYQTIFLNIGCDFLCNDNRPLGHLIRNIEFY